MATTSPLAAGYVLVGVGTSPAAMAAARWAAAEAVRRGAVLYAIHVLPATHSQDDLTEARRRVPTRVGDWLADTTTLPVVAVRVTSGDLAQELGTYARTAAVAVLGSPEVAAHDGLPHLVARGCPGAVVVVDAEGRAHQIASHGMGNATDAVPVVRDVMSSPAITVEADDLLAVAVRRLDLHNVTNLPVLDSDGHLVGVVGEADVVRRLARMSPPDDGRVRDAMSPALWSVSPDETLPEVTDLFSRTSLKSLPVVLHNRVVGVVSRRDLVRATARHHVPATLGAAL
jgi:CBS domain-containing protein